MRTLTCRPLAFAGSAKQRSRMWADLRASPGCRRHQNAACASINLMAATIGAYMVTDMEHDWPDQRGDACAHAIWILAR